MKIMAIDLGSTNIKIAVYDDKMNQISTVSETTEYFRDEDMVEFDAEMYFDTVKKLMGKCCRLGFEGKPGDLAQIVLTGQAESIVVLGDNGRPLRNGISWMDMRSRKECAELSAQFGDRSYAVTGEPEIIPTWPITKILWLKRNEPEVFRRAAKYTVIKDYIYYRLTGLLIGECSVYNFTHYFDISKKCYWTEILDYCGVSDSQLPELTQPCTCPARLTDENTKFLEVKDPPQVNIGTLDHFAGMIGTGNIRLGIISIAIGTVISIATMLDSPVFSKSGIPLLCGPIPGSYVYLPVCESGGFSLEWYRARFAGDMTFSALDREIMRKKREDDLIFLPYLMGTTPPEFDKNATGVFYGLRGSHDRYDCAKAVMEGVAFVLKKNIDYFSDVIRPESIILTGGGSKSKLWSSIIANATGLTIEVPEISDAPIAGAAIIGLVSEGAYPDYETASQSCIRMREVIAPSGERADFEKKYDLFNKVYSCLRPLFL